MDIHLDPVGGIAGDMFIAAALDAFPDLLDGVLNSIRAVASAQDVHCELLRHRDEVLAGARFVVTDHSHHDRDHHHHTSWRSIRMALERAPLADDVRSHAVSIFELLAEAEAQVHGMAPEEVTFHEVGAADSVADIVGAAYVIAALGPGRWSVAPLPLGSGRIRTAHGVMPVPAPAVARLLEGFLTHDDGIPGERVTPTGAAILRHLHCEPRASEQPREMRASGIGFGTRALPGLSNHLRLLAFREVAASATHRQIAVIEFEVDDQTGEELALGLERLRAVPGVQDVLQMPAFGKKGRMMAHVQLLARPGALEEAIGACFRETTTIGLRHRLVEGAALRRRIEEVQMGGAALRVKVVERPGVDATAKTEIDDAAGTEGHARRAALRQEAERAVLARGDGQ
jgi:uncharacterized protein (TIGR00299 family) protein